MIDRPCCALVIVFLGSLFLTTGCGEGFDDEPTADTGAYFDAGIPGVDGSNDSDADAGTANGPIQLDPGEAVELMPNAIKEILAHEFQHLIHFNRSVLLNDLDMSDDNAYLVEGLGALAQDVSGYQAGNLYVTKAGLEEIDVFSLRDILVDLGNYDDERDGALRGGAYLFIRWIYDRAGGDEAMTDGSVESRGGPSLIRALIEAPESVAAALPELTGSSTEELAVDFYTAVGVSNRDEIGDAAPMNPCFQYLPTTSDPITDRQRGANLFASFHGQAMEGPAIQVASAPDGTLSAGGVEYLLLEAETGQSQIDFIIDVHPTAEARLRIVRIR